MKEHNNLKLCENSIKISNLKREHLHIFQTKKKSYKEVNMFTEGQANLRAELPKISSIFYLYHLKPQKNIVF